MLHWYICVCVVGFGGVYGHVLCCNGHNYVDACDVDDDYIGHLTCWCWWIWWRWWFGCWWWLMIFVWRVHANMLIRMMMRVPVPCTCTCAYKSSHLLWPCPWPDTLRCAWWCTCTHSYWRWWWWQPRWWQQHIQWQPQLYCGVVIDWWCGCISCICGLWIHWWCICCACWCGDTWCFSLIICWWVCRWRYTCWWCWQQHTPTMHVLFVTIHMSVMMECIIHLWWCGCWWCKYWLWCNSIWCKHGCWCCIWWLWLCCKWWVISWYCAGLCTIYLYRNTYVFDAYAYVVVAGYEWRAMAFMWMCHTYYVYRAPVVNGSMHMQLLCDEYGVVVCVDCITVLLMMSSLLMAQTLMMISYGTITYHIHMSHQLCNTLYK